MFLPVSLDGTVGVEMKYVAEPEAVLPHIHDRAYRYRDSSSEKWLERVSKRNFLRIRTQAPIFGELRG